jgi:DNA-binding MarR family transcriptional regulator
MASTKLKENLYWQMFRVCISMKHNLMAVAEKEGLTVVQLYTLCLLEAETSIPMNSLSTTLHCDASNVTGIVDRLLQQDFIKREENPKDRREKMITLTQKGTKLCRKLSKIFENFHPETFQNISLKEQAQLQKILNKVITA